MQLVQTTKVTTKYVQAKGIAEIFSYKHPSRLLQRFKTFADENEGYFHPVKPYIKNQGISTMYNIYAFAHFFEDMDLVEIGRGDFKEDLKRLKEVY